MAQTISIARGSTTVLGDGATKTTLFTLSSGTASRIILGGLSFNGGTSAQSQMMGMLQININSAGNYLPVLYKSVGNNSTRYFSCFPDTSSANNVGTHVINTAVGNTNVTTLTSDVSLGYSSVIYNANLIGAGGLLGTSAQFPTNYVPSNFWMASGDSLVVQAFMTSTAQTITVLYHFVIVTES